VNGNTAGTNGVRLFASLPHTPTPWLISPVDVVAVVKQCWKLQEAKLRPATLLNFERATLRTIAHGTTEGECERGRERKTASRG